jgi:hypothetical protein
VSSEAVAMDVAPIPRSGQRLQTVYGNLDVIDESHVDEEDSV